MANIDQTFDAEGNVVEQWDDNTRLYTDYRISQSFTYADKSVADGYGSTYYDDRADIRIRMAIIEANAEILIDPVKLRTRLQRLSEYSSDPDILAALSRANSSQMTTQELNRLIKVILRRQARITATLSLMVRLVDPELLDDISDTTEAP